MVSLTRTLGRLNERRVRPADRKADFLALASWFAACADDAAVDALWTRAFGLYGARHFLLGEDDPDLTARTTSWWQSRPVAVPVRLRTSGRLANGGRTAAVPDRSQERGFVAARRQREAARRLAVVRTLVDAGPCRLRDLAPLDEALFSEVLALMEEALAAPRDRDGRHEVRTADGRHRVRLLRLGGPPQPVQTALGVLWCEDLLLEVTRTGHTATLSREAS